MAKKDKDQYLCVHHTDRQAWNHEGSEGVCLNCGKGLEAGDLNTSHVAHTLAGFTAGFISEFKRHPKHQEIWNNAIRSWRDLNPTSTPLTKKEIEKLAVKHEAFGFGRSDAKGFTTHGFDPDGLSAFANELMSLSNPVKETL